MLDVQGLKDSFYLEMQSRIAAGNAGRTVVVRGTTRPAMVVVENELPGTVAGLLDTFVLEWTGLRVAGQGAASLLSATCVVTYATDGLSGTGMDRGRALAEMDLELTNAVSTVPMAREAMTVAETSAGATVMTDAGTRIFWGDAVLGAAVVKGERLERTATVEVFGYEQ